MPDIARTLELEVANYVWVINAYNLAFTILLIAAGTISDRYGYKPALLLGTSVFIVASLICGLSASYAVLIFGRVVQGMAAAFMVCGGYALVAGQYDNKDDRVKAFAIIGTIAGSAMVIGPGIGGLITGYFGWQWVFLVKIPVCVVIVLGTVFMITDKREPNSTAKLDLIGSLLMGLLLFSSSWVLLNGPVFANIEFNAPVLVAYFISLLLLFIWVESGKINPAVDIALFKDRQFSGLSLVPLVLAVCYWSLIVFIPQYFSQKLKLPFDQITYLMLFFTAPMFLVPMLSMGIANRWSKHTFFFSGLAIVAVGCLGIAISSLLSSPLIAIVAMIFAGCGAAAIQTQVSGALIASAPTDKAGSVTAVMTAIRQGGFAVGTALLSNALVLSFAFGPVVVDGYTLLFFTGSVIAAVGAAIVYYLVKTDSTQINPGDQNE